jgi:hypothetical protein
MTAEQTGIYEGAIRFHGAEREIPVRGILECDGFTGTAEGRTVVIDIDLMRRGDVLAGFAQITTPNASLPFAVTARLDHDTIIITGPKLEGQLKRVM